MIDQRFLRSAGVRFAVIYAVLLALSALALTSFIWWSTAGLLDRGTEADILADAQGLSDRWKQAGLPALVLTIEDRLAQNIDGDAVYLLVDEEGRRLAGNLTSWPPRVDQAGPYFELPVQRAGMRTVTRVRRYDIPPNLHLLIGRDVHVRSQLRTLVTDSLLWSLLIVCVMATSGAVLVRNLFKRSLANVSATATAIAAGDLTRRVRLSGRGDELDQLAEVINEMLDRIGRLMEGVRQVSNAIAHDLRTPITRARTRLEDAALHARTPEDLHAAIERAMADLDHIVSIFQALLRIAEIEAGSRRASFVQLDIAPLLSDVAELYEAVVEDRGVTLAIDVSGPLLVHGDGAMLQQAVANLLDNAVKFSPDNGAVGLRARSGPEGVRIEVSDQGPGIPPADRQRATERFFRGETARSTPGSGLGLALVSAVAQLHGGSLRLEDAEPGLRAVLCLPAGGAVDG